MSGTMLKVIVKLLVIGIIFFMVLTLIPDQIPVQALDISTGGKIDSYLAIENDGDNNLYDSLTEFELELDAGNFNYEAHLDGSILMDDTELVGLSEYAPDLDFNLNQYYINWWFDHGSLKIGKQRIAWGSGYFFNPTDVINPFKETSKNDMNPRQATESIYGKHYLGNGTLEGVLVTDFQPLGPENEQEAAALAGQFGLPDAELNLPDGFSAEKEFALRYATLVNNYDLAFQYYHGREDYPLYTVKPLAGELVINYPEKDVYGLNLAGTVGDIGIWGEAAYSKPDIGEDYLQAVLGADYTFKNGIHLLGEYYRDESLDNFLPGEKVDIKDFFGISTDYNLTDLITVRGVYLKPFNSDVYMVNGELTYSLKQDVELVAGINRVENKAGTIFAEDDRLFPGDSIYLKLTYYY